MNAQETGARRLVIIRHAHALSGQGSDHARVLSERGLDEAVRAGAWLAQQGLHDLRLCHSDAHRTTQTAQLVAKALGPELPMHARAGLYLAAPDRIIAEVVEVAEAAATCIVVAHNPGVMELSQRLGRRAGHAGAADMGFPPATIAIFEFDGPWTELIAARPRWVAGFQP